jgi:putative peptidoglycan lipid II flippase
MNLFKTFSGIGAMTTISRILGFVRDTIIARVFGASMESDAFFVAFKIPNLLRRISAEGAFTQAFVPVLSEYRNNYTPAELKLFINKISTLLGIVLVIITILGVLAAPWIIYITAPGFTSDPEKYNLTVALLRITFPYIFFISLVSMAGGILNTFGRFIVPAFTPVWLNISFIVGALYFADYFNQPAYALAWSFFVGGVLQLFFQIPFLRQIGCIPKPDFNFNDEGVWRVLKLMGPSILGVSVAQISLLINTIFASFLSVGSVSWLYYADRLLEFPAGILGVAMSTMLLPSLSKSLTKKNNSEYSELINWALKVGILLAAPAAVGLAMLGIPIIITLLFYGAFTELDVSMTYAAVIAYSIGLIGLIMIKILGPAFYAQQNIKTPVRIAIFSLFCTQFMNLLFVGYLQHVGLALSIGLAACINASLLFYYLKKSTFFVLDKDWKKFMISILISLTLMTTVLYFLRGTLDQWVDYSFYQRLGNLSLIISISAGIYFGSLKLLGIDFKSFFDKTHQVL